MSRNSQNDWATQIQNARGKVGRMLVTAVLLTTMFQRASAQSAGEKPDPLIEAAELAAHAQSLLGSCDYQNAERWLKRARSLVRNGHLRSGESDAAGNFSARIEIQLADLRDLKERLDKEQIAIKNLIGAGRIAAARLRLAQAGAPACDARFAVLRRELAAREYQLRNPARCDACKRVVKVLVWTVVSGAVGYGGYWTFERYGRQSSPVLRSPSR